MTTGVVFRLICKTSGVRKYAAGNILLLHVVLLGTRDRPARRQRFVVESFVERPPDPPNCPEFWFLLPLASLAQQNVLWPWRVSWLFPGSSTLYIPFVSVVRLLRAGESRQLWCSPSERPMDFGSSEFGWHPLLCAPLVRALDMVEIARRQISKYTPQDLFSPQSLLKIPTRFFCHSS